MFLAMVTPLLLFNIACASSLLRTFALRVPFSALYLVETSARLIVLAPIASDAPRILDPDSSEGPRTRVEVPRFVGAWSVTDEDAVGSDDDVVGAARPVPGLAEPVVVSLPFVAL